MVSYGCRPLVGERVSGMLPPKMDDLTEKVQWHIRQSCAPEDRDLRWGGPLSWDMEARQGVFGVDAVLLRFF
jgi:hypothetical protein